MNLLRRVSYYVSDGFLSEIFGKVSNQIYLIAILIFGLVIRGRQFLANRSFWLDEAFLANNLKTRGFQQLLEPLDYKQVAPIGFLWAEKLMANLFGMNEYALRLIPFLASIASIYLLYDLVRVLLTKRWGLVIAFAFILPLTLTYFSSELKQYMTDLFVALLLFWFFFRFVYRNQSFWPIIGLGLIGAISIWFSNITPIILLSLGFALWVPTLSKFNLRKVLVIVTSNLFWLISFYPYYMNFIKNNPHRDGMVRYWRNSFLPHQPSEAYEWLKTTFEEIFRTITNFTDVKYLALWLFLLGVFSVFIRKSKWHFIYLFLPFLIHLVLSYFQMYPFGGRLVLYSIPLIILFEFMGIEFIASFFKQKKAASIILSIFLLYPIFFETTDYFANPMMREDIKPVLEYVKNNKQPDDIVYIYFGGHAAFKFYKEKYFTDMDHCIVGVPANVNYDKFLKQFDELENRIWIVFSHMYPPQGIEYINEKIPTYQQLDYFEAEGAKVYLVDKM
ncbi:glycosyltransferase family 39 protein [Fulvivirga lutimaris]|uniref:glycosyltransferase family 39 protein n=1 Tax=Fulvivirga lutimaris TaxID=1819566 RepID=UPI001625644E|nr:glycosyltransferase family 39 protein [Fulvivirga lutimaris]